MSNFHPARPGALLLATLVAATLTWSGTAQAGIDSPVIFNQDGHVDIILTGNAGGFDHLLEPFMVGGNGVFPAGAPTPPNTPPNYYAAWLIGTDGTGDGLGTPMTLVGDPGSPRTETQWNYNWGYFDVLAGQEITFRLTNINTNRIGGTDPDSVGTIASQLFSGSSAVNNTAFTGGSVAGLNPGSPDTNAVPLGLGYTNVTFVSATEINIGFEDLDPQREINSRWQNMTVKLVLTPTAAVPELGQYALLLAGLAVLGGVVRRRGVRGG